MNTTTLKNTLATTLLLGLSTYANMTMANSLTGALGNGSGVTDFYRVTCSTNANGATANMKVNLFDLSPVASPMVSVQVIKGILAKNITDAVDADTTPSPTAIVSGGNGSYDVRVNKTATGAESYKINYTCFNSAGKATGTTIATAQNQ